MDRIDLTPSQAAEVLDYLNKADYPGGYAFIGAIIKAHPEFDQSTAFWFEKARQINLNVRSDPSDVYIRSGTACGLRWDSKLGSDQVANARMLQATSDNIARAVLGQVAADRAISNVNVFLNKDIVGALNAGQTIGGWGGAFYYWNAPFTPPGTAMITTVGDYIRTHPDEYEKFVACNAVSARDAILETTLPGLEPSATIPGRLDAIVLARVKLLFDGLAVNGQAQAPQSAKDDIQARVVWMMTGGPAAGSPDHIGDFTYAGGRWFEPRFDTAPFSGGLSVTGFPTPVRDGDVVKQLDARRAVRLDHQSLQP